MAKNEEMTISMLTEFIVSWFEETIKWIDSVVKVMANESNENKELLTSWIKEDIEIMEKAMEPLVSFSNNPKELISIAKFDLVQRLDKCGISL